MEQQPGSDEQPQVLVGPGPKAAACRRLHLRDRTPTPAAGVDRDTRANVPAGTSPAWVSQVTHLLDVDLTASLRRLERQATPPPPFLLVTHVFLLVLRRCPAACRSWDERTDAATERGGVDLGITDGDHERASVAVVRDAQGLDLAQLGAALDAARLLPPGERDGRHRPTATVTDLGARGVDTGTTVLRHGQATALSIGRVSDRPWVVRGEVRVRRGATLALTLDPRLVDEELGSRLLCHVGELLTRPEAVLLHA